MKKITIIIALLLSSIYGYSQLFLSPTSNNPIIKHSYYKLSYSETHEQAEWVYYILTKDNINGTAKRKNNFKSDPLVKSGSATPKDYTKSGYDRGHLCPAASMTINQTAMDESFYMSNMSPQHPSFNRGKWKQLEKQVRSWVIQEDTLYVVTGPIFKNNIESIGPNNVTVPGYYYKVIYDPTGDQKMIGFIMPNKKLEKEIKHYQVTIDEVEKITGIDFFQNLPDSLENKLESKKHNWNFTN